MSETYDEVCAWRHCYRGRAWPPSRMDRLEFGRARVRGEETITISGDSIDQFLVKQDIYETLMRYARGVDRVDVELIASAFHPDAKCEFGDLVLDGNEIAPAIRDAASSYYLTHHMIGNVLIDVNGDVAYSEAYYLSTTTIDDGGTGKKHRMRAGRYVDRFERRGGPWRIADRIVVEDWGRVDPISESSPHTAFRPGRQGHDDALYIMSQRPVSTNHS